jgi:hypothetical protein
MLGDYIVFFKVILSAFIFLSTVSSYAYLTIDIDKLTNFQSVTNISYKEVQEPEIPKSYLKTGKLEFTPEESVIRRFDIIFFVSIPITFYLTLNIIQIANMNLRGDAGISVTDWNYIYLNTLMIPLYVAFQDMFFMQVQNVKLYNENSQPELQFGFNLIRASF